MRHVRRNCGVGDPGIADIKDAQRRIGVALGLLSGAPDRQFAVVVGEREEGLPAYARVDGEPPRELDRILEEHTEVGDVGVLIFAHALRQRVVAANHEVGQPVVGEQRCPAKRPLSVRPEIIDGIVVAAAVVAAESNLVLAVRPAHRVYELTLAPREIVGIRRIDAEIARHG